jgi:anti-sigma factor RsiW
MNDTLQRLDDLLLAEATEGLSARDATELDHLLAAHPEVDRRVYEHAAAAVTLATIGAVQGLPATLRAKLDRLALQLAPHAGAQRGD